jgi:DNA-repair protein complementing XP-A cells
MSLNAEDVEEEVRPALTDAQVARIERNRQKALLLRQARLASRPYSLDKQAR